MAITNIDEALAGMQPPRFFHKSVGGAMVAGRPISYWGIPGIPGVGTYDTTLNGAIVTAADAGALDFTNPSSPNLSYLTRISASATVIGTLILADRIWHNGGISPTSTSVQNITTPTWPARDRNGSTNGDGIYLGLEISENTGAGSPVLTATYTNSAGVSGRTSVNVINTVSTVPARTFYPMSLQDNDKGVRSVESFQLNTTWNSGTLNLVAYREISRVEITTANCPNSVDILSGGFPKIFDDSALFFILVPSTTTSTSIYGQVAWTQG